MDEESSVAMPDLCIARFAGLIQSELLYCMLKFVSLFLVGLQKEKYFMYETVL